MFWYEYPVSVPFGNANYDAHLGGSHDMDVATPPNMPITALVPGVISDISAPPWGKQVCLKVEGFAAPYMAYLHLAAVNPALKIGQGIKDGDVIGWSGGCTLPSQYNGTSNPTSQNFLNTSDMSSQPQTGIALMRGPVYGSGAGWTPFPPIDSTLDPEPLLKHLVSQMLPDYQQIALDSMWCAIFRDLARGTGIYHSWLEKARTGTFFGPTITREIAGHTWGGKTCIRQYFMGGWCEWINGAAFWYKYV